MYDGKRVIIQPDASITVIQKESKAKIDMIEYNMRIALSKETIIPKIPSGSSIEKTRVRFTFRHVSGLYQIDMTQDTISNKIAFQFELEFLRKPTVDEIIALIAKFNKVRTNAQVGQNIVNRFNKVFENGYNKNPTFAFGGGRMPKSIKRHNIPYLTSYVVFPKPDGVSYFMFVIESGIYILNMTSLKKLGDIPNKSLLNTVILGELMDNNKFLAFDTLFYGGVDVREKDLFERLDYIKKIKDTYSSMTYFEQLPYFYNEEISISVQQAFNYMNELLPKNDGIIFRASYLPFVNNFAYKWKPMKHITIDFSVENVSDDTYKIFTYGDKNKELFTGTTAYPTNGIVTISKSVCQSLVGNDKIPDGTIIEFKYENGFKPVRTRPDKIKPNYIEVAKSTWEDIIDPISETQLLELTKYVLKPGDDFHNVHVVCTYLKLTNDPTIFNDLSSFLESSLITSIFFDVTYKGFHSGIRSTIILSLYEYFNVEK
jgi:hypothetical protein